MTVYEMRTYTLDVGKMGEAVKLYTAAHTGVGVRHKDFVEGFAAKFLPLVASEEVKPLTAAPWGPHP